MRKLAVGVVKIGISVGILAYLVVQAQRNDVFADLVERPKRWGLLAAACGVCFAAVAITFVRWYCLVRALDLPLGLQDAFRLAALGYLFNLAPAGIVGGDVLKAVLLARRQPGHRAEAVATVFVDRVIGLYVLFLVASAAIWLTGLGQIPVERVRVVCQATWILAAVGTFLVVQPLLPDLTRGRSTELVGRLPYVGHRLRRLIEAVRMYRLKLPVLLASMVMSAAVHSLFAVGIYLIAAGLYDRTHTLGTNFVVAPLSAATGVLPINIGPYEAVLDLLYAAIPLADGRGMTPGQGLVVALGYRIVAVVIAAVGVCYYLGSRREVAEVIHEAETETA